MTMDGGTLLHALNLVYELATLALTTLGLAVVFGLLGVMNMAHGEFVMIGAYSVVAVQQWGLPTIAAAATLLTIVGSLLLVAGHTLNWWLRSHAR